MECVVISTVNFIASLSFSLSNVILWKFCIIGKKYKFDTQQTRFTMILVEESNKRDRKWWREFSFWNCLGKEKRAEGFWWSLTFFFFFGPTINWPFPNKENNSRKLDVGSSPMILRKQPTLLITLTYPSSHFFIIFNQEPHDSFISFLLSVFTSLRCLHITTCKGQAHLE